MNNSTCNCAPPPPLPFHEGALIGRYGVKVAIATYTIIIAFGLVLTYLFIITRFRLWHTNWVMEKIPEIVSNPISQILSQGVGLIAVIPYRNDLYLIWLVVLLIAYDNVFTLSGFTLLEKGGQRMTREYLFCSNCVVIGALVITYQKEHVSPFYRSLLSLWALILLKFVVRLFSYQAAERRYGVKNTNLVADYMETEHTLGDGENTSHITYDPKSMNGYKYLVIGEEKVHPVIKPPSYKLTFDKNEHRIVTVERVWESEKRLLKPTIDKDERSKDVCLSFALFKLFRRRFFGFPAAESKLPKTKQFVFEGLLLNREQEKVFRILRMELGFLRDFFHTRLPVAFAFGFPLFNVIILFAMFAISTWISVEGFRQERHPSPAYSYLVVNHKNVDYIITNILLIIIMAMEIFEVISYVFSDWVKVIMVSRHVKSKNSAMIPFIDEMLGLFLKPKFAKSLKNTIGQYSLLKNYNKGNWIRLGNNCLYHTTCAMLTSKMPRGVKEDRAIVLPGQVKDAIFDFLKKSRGNFADIVAPFAPSGVSEDFPWLAHLRTPLHTIMVWHIATSVCEIRPLITQPIIDDTNCLFARFTKCLPGYFQKRETCEEQAIKFNRLVASSLSKYCAYLVVFAPELLPTSTYSAKRMVNQIVLETSEFFREANGPQAHYDKMMESVEDEYKDKIIGMGAELAKYLIEKIPNDVERWEMLADVWTKLILFLAPTGDANGHLELLAGGGEFITHLWVLLYHAGIVDSIAEESDIP